MSTNNMDYSTDWYTLDYILSDINGKIEELKKINPVIYNIFKMVKINFE